ncbi:MAG: hypothetical protein AAF333_00730 [Planctomycetota bacterium]
MSAEDRRALPWMSVLVCGAMLWRWAGLAWVQAHVMRDIGMKVRWSWSRVGAIVASRLIAHIVLIWGSFLVVPGLVAFYFSGYVSVAVLKAERGGVSEAVKSSLVMVWCNVGRLAKSSVGLGVLFLLGLASLVLVQVMLIWTVLPSLLGIDTTDLRLATSGVAWWISLFFLGWITFDLFWTVAGVFEFNELRARRTGGDLTARLRRLSGEPR